MVASVFLYQAPGTVTRGADIDMVLREARGTHSARPGRVGAFAVGILWHCNPSATWSDHQRGHRIRPFRIAKPAL